MGRRRRFYPANGTFMPTYASSFSGWWFKILLFITCYHLDRPLLEMRKIPLTPIFRVETQRVDEDGILLSPAPLLR